MNYIAFFQLTCGRPSMQTSVLCRHVTCDIPTNNLFVKPSFPFLPSITEARIFFSSGGTRLADHAFSNIVFFSLDRVQGKE